MKKKTTGIILGIIGTLLIITIFCIIQYFNINDTASILKEEIIGEKAKVEANLDKMNKTISNLSQILSSEKDAFLEFQRLVANSKQNQSIGGIMSQINEKYPNFEIKDEYKLLMNKIEINRNEFLNSQNMYNSKVTNYNQYIVMISHRIFLKDGFEKIEPFVVSSTDTKESMKTGIDDNINLPL